MHESRRRVVRVLRIKLGVDGPARRSEDDRPAVGFRDGLSTEELWSRGTDAWQLDPDRVLEQELLVLAHAGVIRLVGTIEGVRAKGDRWVIEGTPMPSHVLIGRPDPLHNKATNTRSYGEIQL